MTSGKTDREKTGRHNVRNKRQYKEWIGEQNYIFFRDLNNINRPLWKFMLINLKIYLQLKKFEENIVLVNQKKKVWPE